MRAAGDGFGDEIPFFLGFPSSHIEQGDTFVYLADQPCDTCLCSLHVVVADGQNACRFQVFIIRLQLCGLHGSILQGLLLVCEKLFELPVFSLKLFVTKDELSDPGFEGV